MRSDERANRATNERITNTSVTKNESASYGTPSFQITRAICTELEMPLNTAKPMTTAYNRLICSIAQMRSLRLRSFSFSILLYSGSAISKLPQVLCEQVRRKFWWCHQIQADGRHCPIRAATAMGQMNVSSSACGLQLKERESPVPRAACYRQ